MEAIVSKPSRGRSRQLISRSLGTGCGTVSEMTALRFNVVHEDAGGGWVYAHVPELPEVQTQGEGLEQARSMVLDAITMVLDERRSRGDVIPEPGWALV